MDPRDALKSVRDALSVRQVFGQPVERDGVTVIPAATVIGGGGAGGGESPAKEGEGQTQTGSGSGFGGVMWPAGAFEIRDGHVTWRPAVDMTRIALAAIGVVSLALRLILAARKRH